MVAACIFTACETEKTGIEPMLDVTANNVAGDWKVVTWSDGQSFDNGCYVYLRLIRKDRKMEIYQNTDTQSAQPRKITGEFNITADQEFGAIIRGKYDHGTGEWSHRYIVKQLTAARMVWVALDDASNITVYEKVDSIPAEILDSVSANE